MPYSIASVSKDQPVLHLRRLLASGALCATAAFALPVHTVSAETTAVAPTLRSDVLVVGGTPAGVAAAIAAARAGRTVTLASATRDLGGVLVDADMDQWDLNLAADGTPVEHGLFDEIHGRLGDAFTPERAARTLADLVGSKPRITVRYGVAPVRVDRSAGPGGERVDDVRVADETGRQTVLAAPYVIDATDSADVAALAGARYDVGRQDSGLDTREQAVTLMFTLAGVDWHRVLASYSVPRYGRGGAGGRRAWGYSRLVRAYRPSAADVLVRDINFGMRPDGTVTVNAIDVVGVNGLSAPQLARADAASRVEAFRLVGWLRERLPGFARARVAGFAPQTYVRETRHVAGLESLETRDVWDGRIPADSIGLSSYPIDLHPVDATDEPAYAPVRHVYGVPFGALVPRGLANLALASPAISASHLASGSARVIPTTIEEGEADGVAAALAGRDRLSFVSLARSAAAICELRRELAADGSLVGTPFAGRTLVARRARAVVRTALRRDPPPHANGAVRTGVKPQLG